MVQMCKYGSTIAVGRFNGAPANVKVSYQMQDFIERAKVIAMAAVSWLIVIQVALQTVLVEVDITMVAQYGGQALALIGGVILVIRRVTPVESGERGVLPSA